jgi:hypothetical protein
MEKFPKLKSNQVALLRADINTGHILDEKFDIAVNDYQKVFTIFRSLEEALIFSKKLISEKNGVEVVIYGKGKQVLYYMK